MTDTSWPRISANDSEHNTMPSSAISTPPLTIEMDIQSGSKTSLTASAVLGMNWWGKTQTSTFAPDTASLTSVIAFTFFGSVMPGKYFTFSWSSLMISENVKAITDVKEAVSV